MTAATTFPEFNSAVTELTSKVSVLLSSVTELQGISNVQTAIIMAEQSSVSADSARDSALSATSAKTESAASEAASEAASILAMGYMEEAKLARNQATEAATGSSILVDLSGGTYPPKPIGIGGVWKVVSGGVVDGITYVVGDTLVYSEPTDVFYKIDNAVSVTSVAGKAGAVILDIADVVGLPDELSGKATAAQGALADTAAQPTDMARKVDKADGKQLSSNDYTTDDKDKLAGVSAGATLNATNSQLRDRTTHTGTQSIPTVTGLQAALDTIDNASKTNTATSNIGPSRSLTVTVSPSAPTTQQQHSMSVTTKYQSNSPMPAGGWVVSIRGENQVTGNTTVDKSVVMTTYTVVTGGAQLDKALGFEAVVAGLDGTSNINQGAGFYSPNMLAVQGISRINKYYAFANDWKDGLVKNVGRYLKAQEVVGGSVLRELAPAEHPGYVANRYYGPKNASATQPVAVIAGYAYVAPFYCSERTLFSKIGASLLGAVAGSTVRLGIAYLEGGVPTGLIYGSAAMASTAVGSIEASGINVTLEAGSYALVVLATHAVTLRFATVAGLRDFFGRTTHDGEESVPLFSVGAGALPAMFPAPAGYFSNNHNVPDLWLRK